MKSARYLFAIILISITALPYAQKQSSTLLRFRDLMTTQEMQSYGLHKLTPAELQRMEVWMNTFGDEVAKAVQNKTTRSSSTDCVIETEIDGEFNGWTGTTIFKLTNGQIWQQSSYDYTYEYAYRPEVLIYKSGGVYKMRVEDVDDVIEVRRLK